MADMKEILSGAEERMEEAVMYLEDALSHIRAGKANIRLLDNIRVAKQTVMGIIKARHMESITKK